MFGVQILFPASNIINGISWYVSALIICFPIVIYFLRHYEHMYMVLIAPLLAMICYGYFLCNWGHVDFGFVWIGSINGGVIRAIGGLSAGVFCFRISSLIGERIQKINADLLATIECLLGSVLIIWAIYTRQTKMDGIIVLMSGLLIIIAFNENGWLSKLSDNIVVYYLGKISYSIYLNQLFVGIIVQRHWITEQNNIARTIVYIMLLIIFSMATNWLIGISAKIKKFARK